jgi:hypothetical protein
MVCWLGSSPVGCISIQVETLLIMSGSFSVAVISSTFGVCSWIQGVGYGYDYIIIMIIIFTYL